MRWLGRETALGAYAVAGLLTVQLFILRCVVLAFSLPVFAVFVAVGLATGLSMRDVRRWSAGREFGGPSTWSGERALQEVRVRRRRGPGTAGPTV